MPTAAGTPPAKEHAAAEKRAVAATRPLVDILQVRTAISLLLFLLAILAQLAAPAFVAAASAKPFHASVVKVQDGDSLLVRRGRRTLAVRLWGIDAPEWDQPDAELARKYLRELLAHREVRVEPVEIDVYGRTVAEILVDGRNVSELLVENGLAWVHVRYCNRAVCSRWRDAQDLAKRQQRGLWRGGRDIPPWQWKKMKSRRRH